MPGPARVGAAQDGFYCGVGLGLTHGSRVSSAVPLSEGTATGVSLALIAGKPFARVGNLSCGIEGAMPMRIGVNHDAIRDDDQSASGHAPPAQSAIVRASPEINAA